jgi:hypothetical protein
MRIDAQKILYIQRLLTILGVSKTDLEKLHSEGSQFGIISAYRSSLPRNENKRRTTELIQYVQALGLSWESAQGVWSLDTDSGSYSIEGSLVVYDISFEDLIGFGKLYDQDAVVFKPGDGPVGIYDLRKGTAVLLQQYHVETNVPRPRKEILEKKTLEPQTKFRDTKLTYDFDWSNPISFGNSPVYPVEEEIQQVATK